MKRAMLPLPLLRLPYSGSLPQARRTFGRVLSVRRSALLALLSAVFCLAAQPATLCAQETATLTTLYSFGNEVNGEYPSPLVEGSDGNFYGTTYYGGTNSNGTVFRITPAGAFITLYSFSGNDGSNPAAPLVLGSDGNFYGTTEGGGTGGAGTVFQITPAGALTTLYSFSILYNSIGSNGENPAGALVQGDDGNFYGTTVYGGINGNGTVFQITPAGALTTLYSFSGHGGGGDSVGPSALVQGKDSNFYGTTIYGGASNNGMVFQITSTGILTTLHTFSGGSDGGGPNALIQGGDGNFYGTTEDIDASDEGTVFQITPTGALTTLHTFSGGSDGGGPSALVQGSDGNFYGTTGGGGTNGNYGTAFQITPAGELTTLCSFDLSGVDPDALVQGSDGNFYGTTGGGGLTGETVFALSVHPAFFTGQTALDNGVYYLEFPDSIPFGYYSFLNDPNYIFHFDLGYEYVFYANDGNAGVYLYDFSSGHFFYTSPVFPFPYLYDFSVNSVLYYYPDTSNPGHYTSDPRYFYNFATGRVFTQ